MTNPNTSAADPLNRIGYMQGRLCDLVDGKIQAFPWDHWQDEFPVAQRLHLGLMEWTLDHDRLTENPFMTAQGRREIRGLCREHGLSIPSLTGDLFMQAPFYKACGTLKDRLVEDFHAVLEACRDLGVSMVVMPLVDGGALESPAQEDALVDVLEQTAPQLKQHGLWVIFESDFQPPEYRRFLDRLDRDCFGVNHDTGNSAALGFDHAQELALYGDRIRNVHIKDRIRGGTTVPLGTGDADLAGTVNALEAAGYDGAYILQTARAQDNDHAGVLARYRDMTRDWIKNSTRR